MKFLSPIIDRLQAVFPPNRVMLLLAAPIVAASAWISGVVSTNIPGVELPVGVVAGIIGAAVLIAVTLIYKWFDQWQKGEPVHIGTDLENAFDEVVAGHQAIDTLLGHAEGVGKALEDLHQRVTTATINDTEIAAELKAIGSSLDVKELLAAIAGTPEAEVPSPAPAAPPTAGE